MTEPAKPEKAITQRDYDIWRAAITLAHNICVQESDHINSEDGSLFAVHATADCAKRIRGWIEPTEAQMREMFAAPELLEALKEVLQEAVILSDEYLEIFQNWPDDKPIQGWEKSRWLRALAAKKKALAVIARAERKE